MKTSATVLVSIVLPVYNGARYLEESVQSCLDQTYPDWELIIVDDASTDGTPALIGKLSAKDSRIRSIRHEVNKRLPATLNTGFAHAKGAYLSWTSDDNRYRPQALEEMVGILSTSPTVDFVYADFDIIDEDGQFVQTISVKPPLQLIQGTQGLACFLYRRRVYEQIGNYAEDLFLAEDYEYWLRILAARLQMYPLHRNLYEYRRHRKSLTDEYRGRTFAAAEQALLRNLPKMTWASTTVRGKAYLYLASLAAWRSDQPSAFRHTLRALRYTPALAIGNISLFFLKHMKRQIFRLLRRSSAQT